MIVEQLKTSLITKHNELKTRLLVIENNLKKDRLQDLTGKLKKAEVIDENHYQILLDLQQINRTLAMLKTEQYGICTECGKHISKERLDALPYIKTCDKCSKE